MSMKKARLISKKTTKRKLLCEEKLACLEPESTPVYKCNDCNSLQCASCENELHKDGAAFFHIRLPLEDKCLSQTIDSRPEKVVTKSPASKPIAIKFDPLKPRTIVPIESKIDLDTPESPEEYSEAPAFPFTPIHYQVATTAIDSCCEDPKTNNEQSSDDEYQSLNPIEFNSSQLNEDSGSVIQRDSHSSTKMKGRETRPQRNLRNSTSSLTYGAATFADAPTDLTDFQIDISGDHFDHPNRKRPDSPRDSSYNNGDDEIITSLMESMHEVNLGQSSLDTNPHFQQIGVPVLPMGSTCPKRLDIDSFLLLDDQEALQVANGETFKDKLKCCGRVKVVSIFGNAGTGKSFTLNQIFFNGEEVFKTSPEISRCTAGVWAAYDPNLKVICFDTEGLLGVSDNSNKRMRLLLKVLAVSDVVLFRSNAERLHEDMFQFLSDASKAYNEHFKPELEEVAASAKKQGDLKFTPLAQAMGPSIIIFHETIRTNTLDMDGSSKSPEEILHDMFSRPHLDASAFSSIHYVGTKTPAPPTDFSQLLVRVEQEVLDCSTRAARSPEAVFAMLKILNSKFAGSIYSHSPNSFPSEFFSCQSVCMSCQTRCSKSMNHKGEHDVEARCKYNHVYDNKVYICRDLWIKRSQSISTIVDTCYDVLRKFAGLNFRAMVLDPLTLQEQLGLVNIGLGHDLRQRKYVCDETHAEINIVVPKTSGSTDNSVVAVAMYAWAGYILECRRCGIIYRSRQHWYGNRDPTEEYKVKCVIKHIWPGSISMLRGTHNAARKLIDGVTHVASTVTEYSSKPTRMLSDWVADQVAPPYWVPNGQVLQCHACKRSFSDQEKKHHCRACGQGFCDECTQYYRPVLSRGWETSVRVCKQCYDNAGEPENKTEDQSPNLLPRQAAENVQSVLGAVASVAFNYPIDMIKDSARPSYWVPDSLIERCCGCQAEFGLKLAIHHCRSCGKGVCNPCSQRRRPAPTRGWDQDVRVCDICFEKPEDL